MNNSLKSLFYPKLLDSNDAAIFLYENLTDNPAFKSSTLKSYQFKKLHTGPFIEIIFNMRHYFQGIEVLKDTLYLIEVENSKIRIINIDGSNGKKNFIVYDKPWTNVHEYADSMDEISIRIHKAIHRLNKV